MLGFYWSAPAGSCHLPSFTRPSSNRSGSNASAISRLSDIQNHPVNVHVPLPRAGHTRVHGRASRRLPRSSYGRLPGTACGGKRRDPRDGRLGLGAAAVPWLTHRAKMPVGLLFCVKAGPTCGRAWAPGRGPMTSCVDARSRFGLSSSREARAQPTPFVVERIDLRCGSQSSWLPVSESPFLDGLSQALAQPNRWWMSSRRRRSRSHPGR